METTHKNAKGIVTRERKISNKSPKCSPLKNMKLTGDIIRVVNTPAVFKGSKLNIDTVTF